MLWSCSGSPATWLARSFSLVGFARRDWADQDFGQIVHDAVRQYARTPFREDVYQNLAEGFRFVPGSFDDDTAFDQLSETVHRLERERGTSGNLAFYLSIPPAFFAQVCQQLERSGLARRDSGGWRRVVIEKPFGHDLASAQELERVVSSVFPPDAVFRIDHYLGIGAARDVIQNHLLQLLALTAMEEPSCFEASALRAEKEKALAAVRVPKDIGRHTAHGQYAAGWQGGEEVIGYLQELGVAPDSTTETYAAIRLDVATRLWAGVPFYLRTGKRLGKRVRWTFAT